MHHEKFNGLQNVVLLLIANLNVHPPPHNHRNLVQEPTSGYASFGQLDACTIVSRHTCQPIFFRRLLQTKCDQPAKSISADKPDQGLCSKYHSPKSKMLNKQPQNLQWSQTLRDLEELRTRLAILRRSNVHAGTKRQQGNHDIWQLLLQTKIDPTQKCKH